MWQKLLRNKVCLATACGLSVVLATFQFGITPFIFLTPLLLHLLAVQCKGFWQGLRWGFFVSTVIMIGDFYWITFVLHEFGYLPWIYCVLLFVGFCCLGLGALNFPLYVGLTSWLNRKFPFGKLPLRLAAAWFSLGLPALFTIVEFAIPKLFPWYLGNAFSHQLWLTQILEVTGVTFLTFSVFSLGGTLGFWLDRKSEKKFPREVFAIPLGLWVICIAFSIYRLQQTPQYGRTLHVALIQANIGSLEKVAAKRGIGRKVRFVVDKYRELTERALQSSPRPDLIVWPETAVPFELQSDALYPSEIKEAVKKWKVPLITGGYAVSPTDFFKDYNAAYLLEPQDDGTLKTQIYLKNVLLAFGEYFPFGKTFPILYRYFPQVSNFERGTEQNPFVLKDGTRLGITVCYEDIIPNFYRKAASHGISAMVNLTNDSWFGPTAEPLQHAGLVLYRPIETRVPLIRVTNTGVSFTVDERGHRSETTKVYGEGVLLKEVKLPAVPSNTFYLKFGDWFISVCAVICIVLIRLLRRRHASLSH